MVATTASAPVASTATLEALEFPQLLALVQELAATDLGRARIGDRRPLADGAALEALRRRHRELAALVEEDGAVVAGLEAPLAPLAEHVAGDPAEIDGGALVLLAAALAAVGAARRRIAAARAPELGPWAAGLGDLEPLRRRIAAVLDRRGRVRDDASPELARLRARIQGARDRLYRQLRATAEEHAEALGEETIPLHEGRLVLLVQSGARGRMPGLVHGRSASGRSLYFEPLAAVEANNDLQEAVSAESEERRRLLAELWQAAHEAAPEIGRSFAFLAEIDALQAAVRFAEVADGRLAEVVDGPELRLVGARHPLLEPRLAGLRQAAWGEPGHTGDVEPLELELGGERRVVVVTGPNAGGKTVALKTLGLAALAHQSGLPVVAAAGTRLPGFGRVMASVGDEQDLLHDRSTFSGRLLRLGEAWEAARAAGLVLVDELGSGTDPEEGAALAIALLEELLAGGALGLLTTHLTPLAAAALERPGAWCAAMEFEPERGRPTFRLRPGSPGGSEALALARRLGLPATWIERAEELLGAEHRDLRRLLAEVERLRAELAVAESAAAAEARRLAAERAAAAEARQALEEERRQVGKRLRAELDEFRRKTTERLRREVEELAGQATPAKRSQAVGGAVASSFLEAPRLADEPEPEPAGPLEVGAAARHRSLGWTGTITRLDGGRAEVAVGGKRLRCRLEELLSVAAEPAAERRAASRVELPDAPAPPAELKLIGQRVEEALGELEAYLDRALLAGLAAVRIVHGHGSGRLRAAVREHLAAHPAIASWRAGKANEGGDGATVARLR